jgi:hypothetical protein
MKLLELKNFTGQRNLLLCVLYIDHHSGRCRALNGPEVNCTLGYYSGGAADSMRRVTWKVQIAVRKAAVEIRE